VNKDLGQLRSPPGSVFSVHPLAKVKKTWPDGEPPALVPKTVFRRIEWECRDIIWVNRITNEAASSVRVKPNHEEKCEVMGVPERFEALVTNLVVRGRIHQDHNEQHEVPRDTTRLRIVNLQGNFLTDLCKTIRCEYPHLWIRKTVAYGYARH